MRALRYLVPRDTQNQLNASPVFQWVMMFLMIGLGALLIAKGLDGFKNKRIAGKRGRVFEGTTAEVLGVAWVAIGVLMVLAGVGTIVSKLLTFSP